VAALVVLHHEVDRVAHQRVLHHLTICDKTTTLIRPRRRGAGSAIGRQTSVEGDHAQRRAARPPLVVQQRLRQLRLAAAQAGGIEPSKDLLAQLADATVGDVQQLHQSLGRRRRQPGRYT
jgi:hypothetical protein